MAIQKRISLLLLEFPRVPALDVVPAGKHISVEEPTRASFHDGPQKTTPRVFPTPWRWSHAISPNMNIFRLDCSEIETPECGPDTKQRSVVKFSIFEKLQALQTNPNVQILMTESRFPSVQPI